MDDCDPIEQSFYFDQFGQLMANPSWHARPEWIKHEKEKKLSQLHSPTGSLSLL